MDTLFYFSESTDEKPEKGVNEFVEIQYLIDTSCNPNLIDSNASPNDNIIYEDFSITSEKGGQRSIRLVLFESNNNLYIFQLVKSY